MEGANMEGNYQIKIQSFWRITILYSKAVLHIKHLKHWKEEVKVLFTHKQKIYTFWEHYHASNNKHKTLLLTI